MVKLKQIFIVISTYIFTESELGDKSNCIRLLTYEGYPRSNAQSDVASKHFIFKLHLH
jgi:hypothetical protein